MCPWPEPSGKDTLLLGMALSLQHRVTVFTLMSFLGGEDVIVQQFLCLSFVELCATVWVPVSATDCSFLFHFNYRISLNASRGNDFFRVLQSHSYNSRVGTNLGRELLSLMQIHEISACTCTCTYV